MPVVPELGPRDVQGRVVAVVGLAGLYPLHCCNGAYMLLATAAASLTGPSVTFYICLSCTQTISLVVYKTWPPV